MKKHIFNTKKLNSELNLGLNSGRNRELNRGLNSGRNSVLNRELNSGRNSELNSERDRGRNSGRNGLLTITIIMLTATLFLTGAKFLDVQLLTDGRILDLDEVIKDLPMGGGDSESADENSDDNSDGEAAMKDDQDNDTNPSKDANTNKDGIDKDNKNNAEKLPVNIRVQGNKIYLDKQEYSADFLLQKLGQKAYKSKKLTLIDAYADYETFLKVKDMLDGLELMYTVSEE